MKCNPVFTAKYTPRDKSELTAEAEEWIGWEGVWEVTHLTVEGPEVGMPLCTVALGHYKKSGGYPPVEAFIWVPISDLSEIRWDRQTLDEVDRSLAAIRQARLA
jgi:hypothetical protein